MKLELDEVSYLMEILEDQLIEMDAELTKKPKVNNHDWVSNSYEMATALQNKLWYIFHVNQGLEIPEKEIEGIVIDLGDY